MIIKYVSKIIYLCVVIGIILSITAVELHADGNQNIVVLSHVKAAPGGEFSVDVYFTTNNQHENNGKSYTGIGSFCIPMLFDAEFFAVDSVKFFNTITTWDEKFSNSIPDSGFISIAGIYDMGGKANNPLNTGTDKSEHVATLYFHAKDDAKPGEYPINLTVDPRQGKPYFGSPDGVQAWLPEFTPGKIIIE